MPLHFKHQVSAAICVGIRLPADHWQQEKVKRYLNIAEVDKKPLRRRGSRGSDVRGNFRSPLIHTPVANV